MRTGADYRAALRDGRKVFVMGEGRIDDVTTHPATSAMVEQYVAWYDRHFDPLWADTLLDARPPSLGFCAAEDQCGGGRDRPMHSGNDFAQCWQYHTHSAVRAPHCAWRADGGGDAQSGSTSCRQRHGLSQQHRRHGTVSDILWWRGGGWPTHAARPEEPGIGQTDQ